MPIVIRIKRFCFRTDIVSFSSARFFHDYLGEEDDHVTELTLIHYFELHNVCNKLCSIHSTCKLWTIHDTKCCVQRKLFTVLWVHLLHATSAICLVSSWDTFHAHSSYMTYVFVFLEAILSHNIHVMGHSPWG